MSCSRKCLFLAVGLAAVLAMVSADVFAQRGRGGGGRSASHRSPSASRGAGSGPAMSRQSPTRPQANRSGGPSAGASRPSANRQAGAGRTTGGGTSNRGPNTGSRPSGSRGPSAGTKEFKRPGGSNAARPDRPAGQRPGGSGRPQTGAGDRQRPGGGATSDQLSDFLGTKPNQRPGNGDRRPTAGERRPGDSDRPGLADRDQPNVGDRNTIGDRDRNQIGSRDVNIGEVNVGNQVDFSQDRRAWVDNRHATGNRVRSNAGNRYAGAYRSAGFRRGAVGGYGYHAGWASRGNYYGWTAPTTAALGAFCGATLANARPVYYGYGTGGNVYYEDNTVYVNGQAAGSAEQYAQQALDYVAAAPPPEQTEQDEWLPLGVFVLTQEDAADSNTMLELAINKQGGLAGTYYNESTDTSRPLKGTTDQESQRAVVGFADGSNTDVALEMGIFNLTQDEAPALLHHGTEQSTPVLLVRLPAPEGGSTN